MTDKAEAGSATGASKSPPNPQDGIMGGLSQQHSKWVGLSSDTGSFHNLIRSLFSIKKILASCNCAAGALSSIEPTAQRGPYTAT